MNKSSAKKIMVVVCIVNMLAGCATIKPAEPVKAGEKIAVNFTCRLNNGDIAATTDFALDANPDIKKSSVFVPRKTGDPLIITAGEDEKIYGTPGESGFEGEIVADAAKAVVGMKIGEIRAFEVRRDRIKTSGNEPMVIQMARVRTRAKEIKMTPDEFISKKGKDPEVGQIYTIDPSVPGKVVSVSDEEVVIRFKAEPGKKIRTALGEAEIREKAGSYEIVIDAKNGDLIRSGNMVGRIVNIDDRMITIDYSHPLAYETLKCDVKVENREPTDKKE